MPYPYTKEEISKALKETGYLSQIKINQHPGLPTRTTVLKLFKTTSINNVWKELNIISQKPSYTKKEVVKTLKEIGYLKQAEIDQHPGLPSLRTILRLFKTTSMANVWKELDIPFTPQPSYTKEQIAKTLKKTGYLPQKEVNKHPDLPAYSTIRRLFKRTKMTDVWKELNIDPQRKKVNP